MKCPAHHSRYSRQSRSECEDEHENQLNAHAGGGQNVPIIDAGETKSVVFTIGALVPFGEQTTVKVDVDPVPGETNTANNTAEYPVVFSL